MQVLERCTGSIGRRLDAQGDFAGVLVDVIALCCVLVSRGGFASLDGDLGIVAQGHDQVVSQRLIDMHGERRFDVLGDRGLVGRDGDLDDVTFVARGARLVGDLGADLGLVQSQLLELPRILAADRVNGVDHWRVGADVDVVRRDNRGRTGGAVGRHDNVGAVGQLEVQLRVVVDRQTIFVGQRDGVGNLAAFGYRRARGQRGYNLTDGV